MLWLVINYDVAAVKNDSGQQIETDSELSDSHLPFGLINVTLPRCFGAWEVLELV